MRGHFYAVAALPQERSPGMNCIEGWVPVQSITTQFID
jgi:hypothetical protein